MAACLVATGFARALDLDPDLVADFHTYGPHLLAEAAEADPGPALLGCEPGPVRLLTPAEVAEAARAFGDMVDLQTSYLHGHASMVVDLADLADLADRAGRGLGLPEATDGRVRTAGWTHDLGRIGIASSVWDRPGPGPRPCDGTRPGIHDVPRCLLEVTWSQDPEIRLRRTQDTPHPPRNTKGCPVIGLEGSDTQRLVGDPGTMLCAIPYHVLS